MILKTFAINYDFNISLFFEYMLNNVTLKNYISVQMETRDVFELCTTFRGVAENKR